MLIAGLHFKPVREVLYTPSAACMIRHITLLWGGWGFPRVTNRSCNIIFVWQQYAQLIKGKRSARSRAQLRCSQQASPAKTIERLLWTCVCVRALWFSHVRILINQMWFAAFWFCFFLIFFLSSLTYFPPSGMGAEVVRCFAQKCIYIEMVLPIRSGSRTQSKKGRGHWASLGSQHNKCDAEQEEFGRCQIGMAWQTNACLWLTLYGLNLK